MACVLEGGGVGVRCIGRGRCDDKRYGFLVENKVTPARDVGFLNLLDVDTRREAIVNYIGVHKGAYECA